MSTSTRADQVAVLGPLRTELDALDTILLNVVLMRARCVHRIGVAKGSNGIPVMQPARVREVLERATEFALKNGLNPHALQDLFTILITDACRDEEGRSAPAESMEERIEELTKGITGDAYTTH